MLTPLVLISNGRDGEAIRYDNKIIIIYLNNKNEILIQKRAMCKKTFPGKWDMPSAGHVHAGESSIDACVRETYEELGIKIDKSKFEFIGECLYEEGFEIGQVYFLYLDKDYEFKLEEAEVEEVRWVSLEEFKNIWNTELFPPHDKDYKDMVIELLESKINNKTQE